MILLHLCLALGVAVCALLSGLFYATPGLGYCKKHGVLHCFSQIIAMTEPHFSFLLCVVSGLLALSLCERVGNEEVGVVLLFHICLSGIFSFDVAHHPNTHGVFLAGLILVSLVFSLLVLNDDGGGAWNRAGAVVYLLLTGVFLVASPVAAGCSINIINHVQLAWMVSMVFMFGVFVFQ